MLDGDDVEANLRLQIFQNLNKIVAAWFVKFKNSPIKNDDLLIAEACAWRIWKELLLLMDTDTR